MLWGAFPAPDTIEGHVQSRGEADRAWSEEVQSGVIALASSRGVRVVSWDAVCREGIEDQLTASLLYLLGKPVA